MISLNVFNRLRDILQLKLQRFDKVTKALKPQGFKSFTDPYNFYQSDGLIFLQTLLNLQNSIAKFTLKAIASHQLAEELGKNSQKLSITDKWRRTSKYVPERAQWVQTADSADKKIPPHCEAGTMAHGTRKNL